VSGGVVCVCGKADRARKNAENELHDATSHISEINMTVSSLTSDRKRMETDIHAMQRDLDDAVSSRRAAEDRADKLALDFGRAQVRQLHTGRLTLC